MNQQIIFGSAEALEQLRLDKRHPNWMADIEGYGGNAPLPERDDRGECIVRYEPDFEPDMPGEGEDYTPVIFPAKAIWP